MAWQKPHTRGAPQEVLFPTAGHKKVPELFPSFPELSLQVVRASATFLEKSPESQKCESITWGRCRHARINYLLSVSVHTVNYNKGIQKKYPKV